ncbi:ABC transporter ATP-binding protein/permease [Humidisolicoccus flavus]|uniref:ABC transporter ATP-binding protein/permease n=1 Tax=Humidisolicoccus flavus TaxID=3111414 RepID=UPI00324F7528
MKPFDPRLLRWARSSLWFLISGAFVTVVHTAAIIGFAVFTGRLLGFLIAGEPVDFASELSFLLLCVVVRSLSSWVLQSLSARAAAVVKSQLRRAALERLDPADHPEEGASSSSVTTATVLGRGLDALDGYFGTYVPQLIQTAIATPVLLVVLFKLDFFTGLVVAICLPLIPVFMVLIGLVTREAQKRQWDALERLQGSFLDILEGLPTLKLYGRDRRAGSRILASSNEQGSRTMQVLRISFLSSLVLELAASLSVALVAVSIGVRLIDGTIPLGIAFIVLILTPEAFLPIRMVGAAFHSSTEGLEAADRVLAIIEHGEDRAGRSHRVAPQGDPLSARTSTLELRDFGGVRSGEQLPTVSFRARAGEIVVISGESGIGKSSLIDALLGFAQSQGQALLNDKPVELRDLAWAPQHAGEAIVAGSVRDNLGLGMLPAEELDARAIALSALTGVSLDQHIASAQGGGLTLSGGQVQRLVVARAIRRALSGAPVLIADEPSSALDAATEGVLLQGLRELADTGVIVVLVSHRDSVVAAADIHVEVVREVRR